MAAPMKRSILGVCRILVSNSCTPIRGIWYQGLIKCKNANQMPLRLRYFSQAKSYRKPGNFGHSRTNIPPNVIAAVHGHAHWQWDLLVVRRWMATGLSDEMLRKELDKLTDRFMEAKELLDDARESMGSVYFNEDLEEADKAVVETLKDYKALLSELDAAQRQNVTRTIGLRMEELSAHQAMIRDLLKD